MGWGLRLAGAQAAETEVAFVHPRDPFVALSDPLTRPYGVPLTLGPPLRGVLWAIVLRP